MKKLCPCCKERSRHVRPSGCIGAYCKICRNKKNIEYRKHRKKYPPTCLRCKKLKEPRQVKYCRKCSKEVNSEQMRKHQEEYRKRPENREKMLYHGRLNRVRRKIKEFVIELKATADPNIKRAIRKKLSKYGRRLKQLETVDKLGAEIIARTFTNKKIAQIFATDGEPVDEELSRRGLIDAPKTKA